MNIIMKPDSKQTNKQKTNKKFCPDQQDTEVIYQSESVSGSERRAIANTGVGKKEPVEKWGNDIVTQNPTSCLDGCQVKLEERA